MSLTSLLKGSSGKNKTFQTTIRDLITPRPNFETLSSKKAFAQDYEKLVPYVFENHHNAAISGTGFDYVARFSIARYLKARRSKKLESIKNLTAEGGLFIIGQKYDKGDFRLHQRKYRRGIRKCRSYVLGRGKLDDDILEFVIYLARLEMVARSGILPSAENNTLLDVANNELIEDLRGMSRIFHEKFLVPGIIKPKSEVIFNPHFGGASRACDGADGDVFIDGTLYDFKTSKRKGYRWQECAQLMGYYLLQNIDRKLGPTGKLGNRAIDKLTFYRCRFGEFEIMDLAQFDEEKLNEAEEKIIDLLDVDIFYKDISEEEIQQKLYERNKEKAQGA